MANHGSLDYHLTSLTKMSVFVRTYKNPSEAVITRLDSQVQKRLGENQQVIESLFRIVILLGKQGLEFSGHRDDKIVWMEQSDQEENQENFIEMVRFRAETDHVLRTHLDRAPRNAQYTSKTIQNQLILIIGNYIRSEIIQEIKKAKFYTVLADELSDISNKEQLSISFRYVLDGNAKEVFADLLKWNELRVKYLLKLL